MSPLTNTRYRSAPACAASDVSPPITRSFSTSSVRILPGRTRSGECASRKSSIDLQARSLEDRGQALRGPRGRRALQDDEVAFSQKRHDRVGGRFDVVEVRCSIRPVRCRNGNDERIDLSRCRLDLEPATSDRLLYPCLESRFFDMDSAGTKRFDYALACVDADDVHAARRKHRRGGQTDVAQAQHAKVLISGCVACHDLASHCSPQIEDHRRANRGERISVLSLPTCSLPATVTMAFVSTVRKFALRAEKESEEFTKRSYITPRRNVGTEKVR